MKQKRNDKCACGSGQKYKNCCLNSRHSCHSITQTNYDEFDKTSVFYGFDEKYAYVNPFLVDYEDPCCLVIRADEETAAKYNRQFEINVLDAGEWYVVGGANFHQVSFRFSTAEDAMDKAKEKFAAIRFLTLPDFV